MTPSESNWNRNQFLNLFLWLGYKPYNFPTFSCQFHFFFFKLHHILQFQIRNDNLYDKTGKQYWSRTKQIDWNEYLHFIMFLSQCYTFYWVKHCRYIHWFSFHRVQSELCYKLSSHDIIRHCSSLPFKKKRNWFSKIFLIPNFLSTSIWRLALTHFCRQQLGKLYRVIEKLNLNDIRRTWWWRIP